MHGAVKALLFYLMLFKIFDTFKTTVDEKTDENLDVLDLWLDLR